MPEISGGFFLVSVSHETKHEDSPKNSGKIRSKIRGKIRDRNSKNSGNFRSATFSDLFFDSDRTSLIGWSQMSGRRTSGTSRPSLGAQVLAVSSFIS